MTDKYDPSFHEYTVEKFFFRSECAVIVLSNGYAKPGYQRVSIKIKNVTKFSADGEKIDCFNMLYEDGEVISIKNNSHHLNACIQWNDFKNKKSFISYYEIYCQEISFAWELIDYKNDR